MILLQPADIFPTANNISSLIYNIFPNSNNIISLLYNIFLTSNDIILLIYNIFPPQDEFCAAVDDLKTRERTTNEDIKEINYDCPETEQLYGIGYHKVPKITYMEGDFFTSPPPPLLSTEMQ